MRFWGIIFLPGIAWAALIGVAFLLTGCAPKVRNNYIFVDVPPLSAATLRPCPSVPPVTGELGDLAIKDKALAIEYGKCSARGDTAVDAYQTVARLTAEAKAKAASVKP